jgi:ammonium transporter, Amt family
MGPATKEGLLAAWTLLCTGLVVLMVPGFGLLECGCCRAKNAAHALAKSLAGFAVAALAFWAVGTRLMDTRSPPYELACAAVPVCIVAAVVAERIRLRAFLPFAAVLAGVIYPAVASQCWPGGILYHGGFQDFAGATAIHSVGGWAALAGVLALGPRIGRYRKDGAPSPIPGHSASLAGVGALLLWVGWFGLTAGRVDIVDVSAVREIALANLLAGSAGTLSAMLLARVLLAKPDLGMAINGALGGLVAVSASCGWASSGAAVAIGSVAGLVAVLGVLALDRLHIDDPVGAVPVHLFSGLLGTLAVGLLASGNGAGEVGLLLGGGPGLLAKQVLGVLLVGLTVFAASFLVWQLIRLAVGLRAGPAEELQGLDLSEIGAEAYPHDPTSPALH